MLRLTASPPGPYSTAGTKPSRRIRRELPLPEFSRCCTVSVTISIVLELLESSETIY